MKLPLIISQPNPSTGLRQSIELNLSHVGKRPTALEFNICSGSNLGGNEVTIYLNSAAINALIGALNTLIQLTDHDDGTDFAADAI
jgi:hypothetical protein